MTDLKVVLRTVARQRPLLVASDYDGTLAPIVDDPSTALPDEGATAALIDLAAIEGVFVAVVSGRTRADLITLTGAPKGIALVGSHGAEIAGAVDLDAEQQDGLRAAERDLAEVAAAMPGSRLETKPAGVALHYRQVPADRRMEAAAAALEVAGRHTGLRLMHGKMVVELAATPIDKGHALDRLRTDGGASAVVFLGDDVTDEDAFERLRPDDVGIKVGPGLTAARFRIDDQTQVGPVLERLAKEASRPRRQ